MSEDQERVKENPVVSDGSGVNASAALMDMSYRHTQKAWSWLLVWVPSAVLSYVYWPMFLLQLKFLVLFLLAGFALVFTQITVVVEHGLVHWWFGPGWLKFWHRQLHLTEIESAHLVRNTWWLGWGIRKIPDGWMYNIAGFEAVELRRKNGLVVRLGSDDAELLWRFVDQALAQDKSA